MNLPVPSPHSHTLISFLQSLLALFLTLIPESVTVISLGNALTSLGSCVEYHSTHCEGSRHLHSFTMLFSARQPSWLRIISLCQALSTAGGLLVTCSLKQLSLTLFAFFRSLPPTLLLTFTCIVKTLDYQGKKSIFLWIFKNENSFSTPMASVHCRKLKNWKI